MSHIGPRPWLDTKYQKKCLKISIKDSRSHRKCMTVNASLDCVICFTIMRNEAINVLQCSIVGGNKGGYTLAKLNLHVLMLS